MDDFQLEKQTVNSLKKKTSRSNNSPTLTAQGVCDIISACNDSGVSTLSFGKLKLEFSTSSKPITQLVPQEPADEIFPDVSSSPRTEVELPMDIDDLDLIDPVAAEEVMTPS